MRLLTLVTDAFGGRGGIAKFNRDLLTALCTHPGVEEVVALPRLVPDPPGALPDELAYRTESAGSKLQYAWSVARAALKAPRSTFDGVICRHLNLLPFAWVAARWRRAPLLLVIHGLEARKPSNRWFSNALVSRVDHFVVVSRADASREAVRGGQLGAVVDPDDLRRGIRAARYPKRSTTSPSNASRRAGTRRSSGSSGRLDFDRYPREPLHSGRGAPVLFPCSLHALPSAGHRMGV